MNPLLDEESYLVTDYYYYFIFILLCLQIIIFIRQIRRYLILPMDHVLTVAI